MENTTDNAAVSTTTVPEQKTTVMADAITQENNAAAQNAVNNTENTTQDNTVSLPELPENWTNALGDDFQSLSKFRSIEDVAKSYKNLESVLGKKSGMVTVPNENSSDADIAEFRKAMGVPESADNYKFDDILKDATVDETQLNNFKQLAHELNIPESVAAKLVEYDMQRFESMNEQVEQLQQQKQQENLEALKSEWGNNFQKELSKAANVVRTIGGEEMINSDLANNPEFIKFANKISGLFSEDKFVDGQNSNAIGESVQSKLDSILNDKNHPYWDETGPQHDRAVAEVNRLYSMLYNK